MFWFFLFSNTANNTHSPLATRLNYDWLKTYWDFRVCSRPSLSNTDAAGPLIPSWLYDPPATGPATMWVVRYSYVKARALVEHHIRELCSLMCRDEKVLNMHTWPTVHEIIRTPLVRNIFTIITLHFYAQQNQRLWDRWLKGLMLLKSNWLTWSMLLPDDLMKSSLSDLFPSLSSITRSIGIFPFRQLMYRWQKLSQSSWTWN